MKQITDSIVMVRPVNFRMNEETAVNNYFQHKFKTDSKSVNELAQEEFDTFVQKLKMIGIDVTVLEDTLSPDTPDAIFPNNWISFHENGDVALYPMFAENRRLERREDIFEILENKGFHIENIVDYTEAEEEEFFLEGTGSIILDRVHQKAYCALSARADEELFIEFCEDFEYTPVIFQAYQTVNNARELIYHTNVMMCIGEDFAIICLDCIDDKKERKSVVQHLKDSGKEIIAITEKQVAQFAGNMLQVASNEGKKYLVMSSSAYNSLNEKQIENIQKYATIFHTDLEVIETCGGGSARCMMAEVFLPKK
ncbi:citrulline utilization hydrolase CtlX [Zhouia sp. PK063]|uniref:citrulline utilization hydrolase CtlX n=1 Tax=Zhouia sp. PK063 TaxID=3373602 RepID=UPI0037BDDA02